MSKLGQTGKLLMLLVISATLSFAQGGNKAPNPYYLLLEPSFMKPPIKTMVAGAQKTMVVPAIREEGGGFRYLSVKEIRELNMPRADFDRMARQNSSKALQGIQPQYVRDENRVIQFAILETNNQLAASAVLAPEFPAQFAKIFGPELIVLIPSRNKVYVFPKLAGQFEDLGQFILDEFQMAVYPVSREVFEIKDGLLISIGTFEH